MNQYTDTFDEETETESEEELVDPRKARRIAALQAKSPLLEQGHSSPSSTDGGSVHAPGLLMKTLPIDIASLDTAPLGVATPDEDDLITVQETITNAFEDFQDDLPPIDSNQDEAGDQSDAEEQSGAEDGFEGDPGNAEHAMHDETWMRKLEVARQRKRMKEWYSTRAHIFADERIATAAKVLSIDIDKRIDEFAVWESGRQELRLRFHILEGDLEDWRSNHEQFLGIEFTFQKTYKYTGRSAMWHGNIQVDHFRCHRYGTPNRKPNAGKSAQDNAVGQGDANSRRAALNEEIEEVVGNGESATPAKRKRARVTKRPSIKVGCHSRLACLLLDKHRSNGSPVRVYCITYTYQHNHVVAKEDELGTRYLSQEQKDRIMRLLREGSPVSLALQRLGANASKLAQHGKTRIFRDDIITYEDVYNVHHKLTAQEIHKDTDPEFSAHKWMRELESQGFYTCHEAGIFYGFSSPWQLMQLRDYGKIICFDGTHNIYGDKTRLYTIVVRNGETSFGIPVAFLLTRSTDASVFRRWLGGLKTRIWEDFRIAYQPDAVVTDQGNVEILAIRATFPIAKIQYCAWHVLRVWERRLTDTMLGIDMALSPEQRTNERDKVRHALHKILYTPDKDEALALLTTFQQENCHRVEMLQFLDKNYFKETDRQHWMICFRENIACAAIDTNNYVESWLNVLKMYFLKDKQKRRADTMVYTLVKSVIPFYQYKLASGRLQVGRMSPAQRAAVDGRIKAETYISEHRSKGYSGQFFFPSDDPTTIKVPSFQDDPSAEPRLYELQLDFSRVRDIGEIIHCECSQFRRSKACCKHIALVIIEREPITFYHSPAQWTQQDVPLGHTEAYDAQAGSLVLSSASRAEVGRDSCSDLTQRLLRLDLDERHETCLRDLVERCEAECPRKQVENWRRKRDRQQKY